MDKNDIQQTQEDRLLVLLDRLGINDSKIESNEGPIVDVQKLWTNLKTGWRFVLLCTVLALALGGVYCYLYPKVYTVTVNLSPEAPERAASRGGGIANILGAGSASSANGDAIKISLFPQISKSLPFLVDLLPMKVAPYQQGGENVATDTLTLFEYVYNQKNGVSKIKALFKDGKVQEQDLQVDMKHLNVKQSNVIFQLRKMISAQVDSKTGLIVISVTVPDPQIATQLADTVCVKLQDYVVRYRTQKVQADLDYYTKLSEDAREKMIQAQTAYARRVDYDRSVILQSVISEKERLLAEVQFTQQLYQQMVSQRETAKAKYQESKPVFAVIQPATFPRRPSSVSSILVLLASAVVGMLIGMMWKMFGEGIWLSLLSEVNNKKDA